MQNTVLHFESGLTQKDIFVIGSIIDQNAGCSFFELQKILVRVFDSNIKPGHYVVLGYLVGYCQATEKAHDDFTKHNSICLRQN